MPLRPEELREILERAHPIARDAGALVLEGWRSSLGGPGYQLKAKSDLVTEYDTRCERFLRDAIARTFPSHGVVGEEAEGPQQRDRELVWYLDPIDGTTNFAHGHPFFCIAMGLAAREGDRETPVVGLVIAPGLGTVWSAARGLGATRTSARGTEQLRVSRTAHLEDALLCTGFPANRRASADNNYARFVGIDSITHGVRRCAAAALEICLVADGAYDAFWDLGLKAWDLTAGSVIVTEAGGRVSNMDGTELELHAGRFLASNGALHGAMIETLAQPPSLPPGVA
ncbi:MAG: inositol monophosphatase [Sandaracinaceae bacterium]|nr:inositol monophosphatase [Sandaracinaceae bacterium]